VTPNDVSTPARSKLGALGASTLLKAGGGALGALAIGAVVAALTTTIVFEDNSASSSSLPVSLVEIAPVTESQTCDDPSLEWVVTDRVEGVTAELDLEEALASGGDAWKVDVVDVCVRSVSTRTTSLVVQVADVVETEVTCEASEGAAGDDCKAVGDPGELSSRLRTVTGSGTDRCVSNFYANLPISSFANGIEASTLSSANGRACRLGFGLYLPDTLLTEQLALLQTDRIQFDLVLTATQN
jgi:hypothetical protein